MYRDEGFVLKLYIFVKFDFYLKMKAYVSTKR